MRGRGRWRTRAIRPQDEKGASAVEFAIIASLLLLILFGTITFGIAFNRYQGIQAASREGARLGSIKTSDVPTVVQRVKDALAIINPSAMDANCPTPTSVVAGAELGCISVYAKDTGGNLLNGGAPLSKVANPPIQPCRVTDASSVVVQVGFRMRLNIPLWASPLLPIVQNAEFRCE